MSTAIAEFDYFRGETITFMMDQDQLGDASILLDGSELVTCDVKVAVNGSQVPAVSVPKVLSIDPTFAAASVDVGARWYFTIPASVSETMVAQRYIANVKLVFATGFVDKTESVVLNVRETTT